MRYAGSKQDTILIRLLPAADRLADPGAFANVYHKYNHEDVYCMRLLSVGLPV